jgi:hypothetical protein
MNYLSIYKLITNNAISEKRYKKSHNHPKYIYYELHHIIPRCLNGTNDKNNLVLLTAREHFVAHQLLVKIYPEEYKLVFALKMMCINNNRNHIRNNREYEWIRKLIAKASSESQKGKSYGYKYPKGHSLSKGENNGMYGKSHKKETKDLQSKLALERDSSYYDFLRVPKTEEIIQKLRKTKQTRKYKLISPEGIEYIFDRCRDASKFCGVSNAVLIKLAGNRYGFSHCRNWKCMTISL